MNLNRLFETVRRLEREVAELKRWKEAQRATPEQAEAALETVGEATAGPKGYRRVRG